VTRTGKWGRGAEGAKTERLRSALEKGGKWRGRNSVVEPASPALQNTEHSDRTWSVRTEGPWVQVGAVLTEGAAAGGRGLQARAGDRRWRRPRRRSRARGPRGRRSPLLRGHRGAWVSGGPAWEGATRQRRWGTVDPLHTLPAPTGPRVWGTQVPGGRTLPPWDGHGRDGGCEVPRPHTLQFRPGI
jgi:hypothetical protein